MMEQLASTTYAFTLPTGDKAEIGDILSADFKPHLKLKRWGEECSLDLDLATTEKIAPVISGDKILWTGKNYGAEFFQATDGFKFNIILPKKPTTNVFPLAFNSNNLNFYYQPELTTQEIADGHFRPENVVGSYAVYHATKRDHIVGQTNYRTGKAFHWYRPLIYDAVGKQTWGILNISGGQRTVTVPQAFLDTAVYPVTIDDEFGYHPTSGGTDSAASTDRVNISVDTPAQAGTATSISAYLVSGTYDDGPRRYLLHRQSDLKLIGETADFNDETPDAWVTHDLVSPVAVTVQVYILGHWGEEFSMKYDLGAMGSGGYLNLNYPATSPDPLPTPTYTEARYWIYCTYTPAGGGWTHIAEVDGVAAASIAEIDGVAVASIAELDGVAV